MATASRRARGRSGRCQTAGHRSLDAYRLFFPAAMVHAAIVLPLSLLPMSAGVRAGLSPGLAHGGEMLAGYALAVIAGFLLPRLSIRRLALLFALWLGGRTAVLTGLPGAWAAVPTVAFAFGIAALIVPRFTGAAKKLRNQAIGPLIALIAAMISVGRCC